MVTDGLTKALPRQKHKAFVHQLNLVNIKEKSKLIKVSKEEDIGYI